MAVEDIQRTEREPTARIVVRLRSIPSALPISYPVTAWQKIEQPAAAGPPERRTGRMFERPTRAREFLSWAYAVLWSGIIFVTVPFVRDGVNYVREHWGSEAFTYVVTTIVILASVAAVALLLKRRRKTVADYAWLIGIAGLVVYLTFELKASSPEEAVHFLQYGILSLLLYRAFTHRVRDYSIYVAVTIAGTIVGMIDETVQWLTPRRFFGLGDIWLNFTAVALVQAALAAGIRPRIISGWPDGAGLRRLCRLGAVAVAYLGLCYLNTPDRIAWYTAQIPLLNFIDYNRSVMTEYGYLHGNAGAGLFRSRLTAEELRRLARDRAEEGAHILDRYREREQYREFLDIYTPVTDPFLHEARVHLFRRDIYLERARDAEEDDQRRRQFTIAYWENRILEDYFGELLRASSYRWPAGSEVEIGEHVQTDQTYKSRVSQHLITAVSRQQVFWFFVSIVFGRLLLGGYFGRRAPG